jgi:hypothetical protein
MQIIGAGFGRTGTSSLQQALEKLLGGPCYHMTAVIRQPEHLRAWYAFATGGTACMDWQKLMEGYAACVDFPACLYYRELMATFPQAKVILTLRDSESWWRSFSLLLKTVNSARWLRFFGPRLRMLIGFADRIIVRDAFGGSLEKERCIEAYERHIRQVRAEVPESRLLEFDVRQGWEPLCAFLGAPVPQCPFPHRNAGDAVLKKLFRRTVADSFLRR